MCLLLLTDERREKREEKAVDIAIAIAKTCYVEKKERDYKLYISLYIIIHSKNFVLDFIKFINFSFRSSFFSLS